MTTKPKDYDATFDQLEQIRADTVQDVKHLLSPLMPSTSITVFAPVWIFTDETPDSIAFVNALAKALETKVEHTPKFGRHKVTPPKQLLYGNIHMTVARVSYRPVPPKGTWLTGEFWDCDCKHNYIHTRIDKECRVCGIRYSTRKYGSKVEEVLQTFDADLAKHTRLYNKVFGDTGYSTNDLQGYAELDKLYGDFLRNAGLHPVQKESVI